MVTLPQLTPTMSETVSGIFIDLANPRPEDIDINDIAWSLSRQSRYAGHTMCKIPYTVAQHTVEVSRYVEEACTPGTARNAMLLRAMTNAGPELIDEMYANRKEFAFHGLLHDFAEAYLVDIPTPVKQLPGLNEALKKFEAAFDVVIFQKYGLAYGDSDNTRFRKAVVKWADVHALTLEAHHFTKSRGANWNVGVEKPSLSMIYDFRWPVPNIQAYEELLARFDELKNFM